jgi:GntR family transcriptional regulator, trigonelline degradation regulator
MEPRAGSLRVERPNKMLRDMTTDQLRRAILTLHFKPGQHLVERDLCLELGVSRTSIREALRHLEAEGFIERQATRGVIVASVDRDEARQIYEVRLAIEPEMAKHFAERASDADIADLEAAAQRIGRASRSRRPADAALAYDTFYDAIMRGAQNEVARRLLQTLRGRMAWLRAVTSLRAPDARRDDTISLVQEIVGAAKARDGALMAERCRAFVLRSAAFADSVLAEEEEATGAGVA